MRNFIRNGLTNVKNKGMTAFDFKLSQDNGELITMKGTVTNGNADFKISRILSNGHNCSSVPVFQMPLTDNCIEKIIEIAVEAL